MWGKAEKLLIEGNIWPTSCLWVLKEAIFAISSIEEVLGSQVSLSGAKPVFITHTLRQMALKRINKVSIVLEYQDSKYSAALNARRPIFNYPLIPDRLMQYS